MLNPVVAQLIKNRDRFKTSVCVGLDPDPSKLPDGFEPTVAGVGRFLNEVISASLGLCIAFKPNISFFEAMGIDGLALLATLRDSCPSDIPWIIDGKRGDIGNTSAMQAKFLFDHLGADAVTLHPYMGEDSVMPFIEHRDKLCFVLGLTSNSGAATFEKQLMVDGKPLWALVVRQALQWNTHGNVGLVVGGTQSELKDVRTISGNMPFLVPGVGVQGGDYRTVKANLMDEGHLAIINMSRSVLYCDSSANFSASVRSELTRFLD